MKAVIEARKYVELTYKVIDRKTGQVLTMVEFPLGYVHGVNEIPCAMVLTATAAAAAATTSVQRRPRNPVSTV